MVNAKDMLKKFAGFSIVPIFTALITIFVIPVVSNLFPAEEYGKINLFYSVGILLTTLCTLGLDNSLIRYYFEPPEGLKKHNIQVIALLVGLGVDIALVILAVLFFPELVTDYLFGENCIGLIPILGLYVFASIVLRLLNIDARMEENYRRYNIQSIFQTFITRISFVFLAFISTYYAYSVVAMTIGMVGLAALFLVIQRNAFSFKGAHFNVKNIRILFAFGFPVMATNLVLNLNGMIGKLALSGANLYEAVGIFAIATTLSNVFTIIPTAFSTYWSPFMYKHYKTENKVIMEVHELVMFMTGFLVVLIVLFQDFLFAIVGDMYKECQAYFMLIMLNPIQALICETTAYGIVLKEKPIFNVIASGAGVSASAVVTLLLMNEYGALAAALGVACSSLLIAIIRSVIGQRFYKSVPYPMKTIATSLLLIICCCLNYFIYDDMFEKAIIGFFVIAVLLLFYHKPLLKALKSLLR